MNNYEIHRKRISCKNLLCINLANRSNCFCKPCGRAYILGYRKAQQKAIRRINKFKKCLTKNKIKIEI